MNALEDRLRALGRSVAPDDHEGGTPPDPGPLLERGRRLRRDRVLAVTTGLAVAFSAVLVAGVVALRTRDDDGGSIKLASGKVAVTTTVPDVVGGGGAEPSGRGPSRTTTPPTSLAAASATSVPATTSTTTPPAHDIETPGLWVVGIDGTGLRQLLEQQTPAAWSPDGRAIAYADGDDIVKLSLDASGARTKVAIGAEWLSCLDWSTKGELVWVTSDHSLRVAGPTDTTGREIADLSTGSATQVPATCQWSADGAYVATLGEAALTVRGRDGATVREWRPASEHGRLVGDPVWSPDGLVAARTYEPNSSRSHLVLLDPASSGPGDVASPSPGPGADRITSLAWHRSGDRLFVATASGQYVVRAADRSAQPLSSPCCRDLVPLPDGRFLAYTNAGWAPNNAVTVAEPELDEHRVLVRGKPPSGNNLQECAGVYMVAKQVSPDGRRVAVVASGSYGPRCEGPML